MKISKLNIILFGLMFAALVMNLRQCNDAKKHESLFQATMDTVSTYRNENNELVSSNRLLMGSVSDLKSINAGKDSTIAKLQEVVDKNTIAATVVTTGTSNNVTSNTTIASADTVVIHDTITGDSIIQLYPEYTTQFENRWEKFDIKANKDTFNIDYTVFNEFNIEYEWRRPKAFARKEAFLTITNKNPKTATIDQKAFVVKPKPANKAVYFVAGALSIVAVQVLTK